MQEDSETTGTSKARKSKKNQPWFPPGSEQQAEEKASSKKKPKKRKKLLSATSETDTVEEKKSEPRKRKNRALTTPPAKKKRADVKIPPNQVFVEGFGDTSEERLKEHFQQFGDVAKAIVMTDHKTGKPRGFGFVTFESHDAMEKALAASHTIDKKPVRCLPSNNMKKSEESEEKGWECFVGGLPRSVTAETLQNYFRRFGEVIDGRIMIDEHSKLPRGFGFVRFASQDNISSVIDRSHTIEGAVVTTKIAEPPKKKAASKLPTLPKGNTVFLGGLPKDVSEKQLRVLCQQFGQVHEVVLKVDAVTGRHRGFGFVSFEKKRAVEKCLEATKQGLVTINDRKLTVTPARDKKSKDSHKPRDKRQQTETGENTESDTE